MGIIEKDAFRTMIISYLGIILGYLNKGILFVLVLTTEQIGLINLLISLGFLFAQFANLGTVYSIWKFFPFFGNKEKKHHGFLPFILIIVLFGIIVVSSFTFYFRESIESMYLEKSKLFVHYFIWIFPVGISYVFFLTIDMFLRSLYKNMFSIFLNEIFLRLTLTVLLFLYWFKFISFDSLIIFHTISYSLIVLILILYLIRIKELNFSINSITISQKFQKIILKFSLLNYVNTLGVILITSLDLIMIAKMIGLKAAGIYSTLMFVVSAIQIPYKSVLRITSPLISEFWKERKVFKIKQLYVRVSSILLVLTFGVFILIWNNIIFLFSFLPNEFTEGIYIFLFLMLGRLVDVYFGINGAIFITSKKYKNDIYFTVFLITTIFVLNLWLIPLIGTVGAAISTSIALILYNLGRMFYVLYFYKIHPFEVNQLKVFLLGMLVLILGEVIHLYAETGWLSFFYQTIIFFIFFVLPVYKFRLNEDVVAYFEKGTAFVFKKLKLKS